MITFVRMILFVEQFSKDKSRFHLYGFICWAKSKQFFRDLFPGRWAKSKRKGRWHSNYDCQSL